MDINEATDNLTKAFQQAEKVLFEQNFGVSASTCIDSDEEKYLTFCKNNGKWGLFIEKANEIIPIGGVSRKDRILAARYLNDLLIALKEQIVVQTKLVEEAIEDVNEFLNLFKV